LNTFLRWGYPYIPQPYIDGCSPHERVKQSQNATVLDIRKYLDENVKHHEHARTFALKLHEQYQFQWKQDRWLNAVRGFSAEELQEAQYRFDKILLKECFQCDSRRNPPYLLAILRTVAKERRADKQPCLKTEALLKNLEKEKEAQALEERKRLENPDEAIRKALGLARTAFCSKGFGLTTASRWLEESLATLAQEGFDRYRLATERWLNECKEENLKQWLEEKIAKQMPQKLSWKNALGV
jgi:hypothetical protein